MSSVAAIRNQPEVKIFDRSVVEKLDDTEAPVVEVSVVMASVGMMIGSAITLRPFLDHGSG